MNLAFTMILLKYLCLISNLLIVSNLVSGQPTNQENSNPSLLSELGDFFMQVDETIYKLTNPKQQNENINLEQTENFGNRNRNNYFDQVRQNYEELQKKIQKSLENPANIFRPPEILNLNFQNKGQKSFLDMSLPFLPMNVQLRGKEVVPKYKDESVASKLPKVDSSFSDLSGSIVIGGDLSDPRRIESNPSSKEEFSTGSGFQKRSNRYNKETSNQRDKNRGSSQSQRSHPPHGQERDTGDQLSTTEPDVEGRVLGNLLYSEDTFDKYFKRVLREGKWIVDPKVFVPKEIVENVREFTKNQLANEIGRAEKRKGKDPLNENSRTKDNENDSSLKRHEVSESETKSDVLLAFTSDGVPLKLKVNPIHGNPLKYLNRVLTSAGVSLNIPIDSHRSLQPAGKDVLQLGSRSDRGQTHAMYVDLTDENQLNSLLETLKSFRN